ncbi:hypothetical protein [Comamonas sp. JC664]|uniref:hypothetical protein n=1 Tax=Comamonas sp. JC664 TaxID=2801917 RepID=UPI003623F70A
MRLLHLWRLSQQHGRAPAPAPAAAAPAKAGLPAIASYALPLDALHQIASTAGLQWITPMPTRSQPCKRPLRPSPKPVHVPRERQPVVQIDQGPLILVETRKDLTDLVLPFERESA